MTGITHLRRSLYVIAAAALATTLSCGTPAQNRSSAGSSDTVGTPGGALSSVTTTTGTHFTGTGGPRPGPGKPVPTTAQKRPRIGVSWPGFGPSSQPTQSSTSPSSPVESSSDDSSSEESGQAPSGAAVREFSLDWYTHLVDAECGQIQDEQAQDGLAVLLRGLRAACPAITAAGAADWNSAQDAYDALSAAGGVTGEGCEERNGYLLLEELVTLHRAHPNANFQIATGETGSYSGC
jgi:hypothetical protein